MFTWSVVVPLKRLTRAKSRLRGVVPHHSHQRLVTAMLADTIGAALTAEVVDQVLVVSDEPGPPDDFGDLEVVWVTDDAEAGLNAALETGEAVARHSWPGTGVAALAGDLPALRAPELSAALQVATSHSRAFVADAGGQGTTLLTAAPTARLTPRFGAASAAAHRDSGAVPLAGPWPSLRRDVDTAADLATAREYGLGARTATVLASQTVASLRT